MTLSEPILLASASPRRRQLLSLLGLPYEVTTSPIDEDARQAQFHGPNDTLAQWLAEQKALGIHTLPETAGRIVITADTTVLLDDNILGKPRDAAHAHELLLSLRNRWHHVITGVAVSQTLDGELQMRSASCTTPVLMRPYSKEDILAYIATGDPLDKAGSYGIQHPSFQPTARIQGCYLNVVGLPLCTLVNLLAAFDVYPTTATTPTTPTTVGRKEPGCSWSEKCEVD
ncbi:MAG TPA: Maf family protein [Ktedonobacteraceae bacterium]|nr:Maf family protein [Ktedonobacteraceae bacterium]